jgi:Uridine kinase
MKTQELFKEITGDLNCQPLEMKKLASQISGELVGIAGPSCSGKTTLASDFSSKIGSTHINLDDYWKHNRGEMARLGITGYDWASRKTCFLLQNVAEIREREGPIRKPLMDRETEEPLDETEQIEIRRPVIMEGTLDLSSIADQFLYCYAPEDILIERRMTRDRGRTGLDNLEAYIKETSMPNYRNKHLGDMRRADIIVDTCEDVFYICE